MSNNLDTSDAQFEDDYYVVEEALDIKKGRGDTLYVFLKWKGYSETDNTWEPITNLNPEAALSICRGLKDIMRKKANAEKTGTTFKKKLEHTRRAILEWKALLKKAQAEVDSSLSHHENDFSANEQTPSQNTKEAKVSVTNQKSKNIEATKKVSTITNDKPENQKSTKGNLTPLRQKSTAKVADDKSSTNNQVQKDQTSTKADKNPSVDSMQQPNLVNNEVENLAQNSDPVTKKNEKISVNKNSVSTSTGKITPKMGNAKVATTTTTVNPKVSNNDKPVKDDKKDEFQREVKNKLMEETNFNTEDQNYSIRKKQVAYEDLFDEKQNSTNFSTAPSTSLNNKLVENLAPSKSYNKKIDSNQNYSSNQNKKNEIIPQQQNGTYGQNKNKDSSNKIPSEEKNKNNRNFNKNSSHSNQKQPYNYFTKKTIDQKVI